MGAVAALLAIVLTLVVIDLGLLGRFPARVPHMADHDRAAAGWDRLVMGTSRPARSVFGIGVLIGWPLGIIVSGGLCFVGALTPFRLAR